MAETKPSESSANALNEAPSSQDTYENVSNAALDEIREDQVQNAVAFLSHPKVRSSSDTSKRSFLERKGLNTAEIEEAFRRVPPVSSVAPSSSSQGIASPLQNTLQHLQPSPISNQQQQDSAISAATRVQHGLAVPQQQPLRWSQVALGAGFFAAGAYAVKQLLWPYVWDAYESWRERQGGTVAPVKSNPQIEGALDDHTSKAVAQAIQAQTAELGRSIEAIRDLATALESQRKQQEQDAEAVAAKATFTETLSVAELRQELKTLASSLQESINQTTIRSPKDDSLVESELAEMRGMLAVLLPKSDGASGMSAGDLVQTSSAEATPSEEKNSSREQSFGKIEDQSLAKPNKISSHDSVTATEQDHGNTAIQVPRPDSATSLASSTPSQPPHPPSYMEVLDMLQKGITPPGIRTDIDDTPPDPEQPIAQPRMKPRPKPWEKSIGDAATRDPQAGVSTSGLSLSDRSLVDTFGAALPKQPEPGRAHPVHRTTANGTMQPASSTSSNYGADESLSAALVATQDDIEYGRLPREANDTEESKHGIRQHGKEASAQQTPLLADVGSASSGVKPGLLQDGNSPVTPAVEVDAVRETAAMPHAGATGLLDRAAGAHNNVFRSPPRGVASIYEAASSPASPGIIIDRFSPLSTPSGARSGNWRQQSSKNSTPSLNWAVTPQATPAFVAGTAEQQNGVRVENGGTEEREGNASVPDGSGIARPLSSGWQPPPIPVPTLLSSRIHIREASASSHSLGEDFSSSV